MKESLIKSPAFTEGQDYDIEYSEILEWATDSEGGGLPQVSAVPFSHWLDLVWNDFDDGSATQKIGDVLSGALAFWKGET